MAIIHLTQYLRPSGKPALVMASIPDDLVSIAEILDIGCENLGERRVNIWASKKGQSSEDVLSEIADNIEGPNSPQIALERLIRRFKSMEEEQ